MVTATIEMTERQREIFDFIKDKIVNRGYEPTVREIGKAFGIGSPNGVMAHLKALEKKGFITRDEKLSRSIRIVGGGGAMGMLELLTSENCDGSEITIGPGRYRLTYLRPATNEEMQ
jgi:SOS-response transcriptional repressor LexA